MPDLGVPRKKIALCLSLALIVLFTHSSRSSAEIYVQDTFTDTPGTLLENHVGEIGATWAKNGGATSGSAVITPTSTLRANTGLNVDTYYYASGIPDTPNYTVQADFTTRSVINTGNFGIQGRESTSTQTFYWGIYDGGAGEWAIYKRVSGALTKLTSTSQSLGVGQTYTMQLQMLGSSLSLYVNNVQTLTATDSTITQVGRGGIGFYSMTSTDSAAAVMADNFMVAENNIAANGLALTGSTRAVKNATSSFTVTPLNGLYTGTVTPSDGGKGGAFYPATLSFASSSDPQTFYYKPAVSASTTISISGSPSISASTTINLSVRNLDVIIDDWFNRSDTSLGGAGSTNVGNGWVDVLGNVWRVANNMLAGTPVVGGYATAQLLRPLSDSVQDQWVIATTPASGLSVSGGKTQEIAISLRYQTSGGTQYLFLIDTYPTPAANIYQTNSGGAANSIDNFTSFSIDPTHQYQLEASAVGISPTTLTYVLTDLTTGSIVFNRSATNSTASQQQAGQMGVVGHGAQNGTTPDVQFMNVQVFKAAATSTSATTTAFTGPASGIVGQASTNFSITPVGGEYTGTITPSDSGAGGTFTPSSLSFTNSSSTQTFTYTPSSSGVKTISISSSPALTNPASISYTARPSAPVISSVASSTATSTATITWSTNKAASSSIEYGLTTSYGTVASSSATSSHTVSLSGLTPATTYNFRVQAVDGTSDLATTTNFTFTTAALPVSAPTVTQQAASNVATSTVTLNGTITSNNNASSTVRGFEYGLTTSYGIVASTNGTYGTGAFAINVSGLTPNTLYHYRAFATNSAGTGVSTDGTFTTSAAPIIVDVPTVTAEAATGIASTSVTLNGTIVSNNNATSTVRGFRYGLTTSYTATSSSSGTFAAGSFSALLTGLLPSTTYHYQAFAVNASGTGVSADGTFTTDASTTPVVVVPVVQVPVVTYGGSAGPVNPLLLPQPPVAPSIAVSLIAGAPNLGVGVNSIHVLNLQKFLNEEGYIVSKIGAGSPGRETRYFGPATRNALARFQKASGIMPAAGYFGPITKAFIKGMK